MCDDHPGLDAVERSATEGVLVRSPGRISDMAALLRGVDNHNGGVDGSAEEWARENSPMLAYSVYGFDDDGAWGCVYICRYSGNEPILSRPWRHAVKGEPGVDDYPYDPRQLSTFFGHGFDTVPRDVENEEVLRVLEHDASTVPWEEWVKNDDVSDSLRVVSRGDALSWVRANRKSQ